MAAAWGDPAVVLRCGVPKPDALKRTSACFEVDGVDPDAVRYRRATATGTYDTEHGFVLYGRTQDSQAGNHMLTPLVLSDVDHRGNA